MDIQDLHTLTDIIDSRVERAVRGGPRYEYGIVSSVSIPDGRCQVELMGNNTPSAGFRFPRHMVPLTGQLVRVVLLPDGDRWIDDVLAQPFVGGDPSRRMMDGYPRVVRQGVGTFLYTGEVHGDAHPRARIRLQNNGLPIVDMGDGSADPAGKLAHMNPVSSTTAGTSYPIGLSMFVIDDGTWPEGLGHVVTFNQGQFRLTQWFYSHQGGAAGSVYVRHWHTNGGGWFPWRKATSLRWLPIPQDNVISGDTTNVNLDDALTPQVSSLPTSGLVAVTGRVHVSGTTNEVNLTIRHFTDGAFAGSADAPVAGRPSTGMFMVEPGGTNGRQIRYNARPQGGTLTYHVQVNGYFTDE